jgi:hypothetical protein
MRRDGAPVGTTLRATLWCADCVAEHRPEPGRLGQLVGWRDELYFLPHDPRYGRLRDPVWQRQVVPGIDELTAATEFLTAWCRYHGEGRVLGREVLGRRGTLVVKLESARA